MKTITRYEAFDGKSFGTAEECKAYEAVHVEARLCDLTIDDVRAALARENVELADALEEIGRRCGDARRAAGEFKRKPKTVDVSKLNEAGPPDGEFDPAYRGDRDFKAGRPGIIPDDLRSDKAKAEKYMEAWDAASLAAGQASKVAA